MSVIAPIQNLDHFLVYTKKNPFSRLNISSFKALPQRDALGGIAPATARDQCAARREASGVDQPLKGGLRPRRVEGLAGGNAPGPHGLPVGGHPAAADRKPAEHLGCFRLPFRAADNGRMAPFLDRNAPLTEGDARKPKHAANKKACQ